MERKQCTKCGEIKNIDQFYKHGDGRRPQCKKCEKPGKTQYYRDNRNDILEYKIGYHQDHREKNIAYQIEYRKENKDSFKEANKQYRLDHKNEIRTYQKEYEKNKRQVNPNHRIRHTISANINNALKNSGSSKRGESILKYLSYSIEDLKLHLEKQFEPWMTWKNYGRYNSETWNDQNSDTWTWQIDHIIPQADLPYTDMSDDNFQKCWSLNNLRPYSSKSNIIDGSSRVRHKGK